MEVDKPEPQEQSPMHPVPLTPCSRAHGSCPERLHAPAPVLAPQPLGSAAPGPRWRWLLGTCVWWGAGMARLGCRRQGRAGQEQLGAPG